VRIENENKKDNRAERRESNQNSIDPRSVRLNGAQTSTSVAELQKGEKTKS
jgi:hypothetical protein